MSVGYQRKRGVLGGAWEGHLTTAVLLVAGVIFVFLVVYVLLTQLHLL